MRQGVTGLCLSVSTLLVVMICSCSDGPVDPSGGDGGTILKRTVGAR